VTWPLHGATDVTITPAASGITSPVWNINVYGTNESLSPRVNDLGSTTMLTSGTAVMAGSTLQIPLGISADPCRLFVHSSAGNTNNQIVRLIDVVTGIQLQAWTVVPGNDINQGKLANVSAPAGGAITTAFQTDTNRPGYYDFAHTMNPMYLQLDAVASNSILIAQVAGRYP
jgi:hypothetical protein